MEFLLIILLIASYVPWIIPVVFVIMVFVWLYHFSVALFWTLIVTLLLICVMVFISGNKE